MQALILGLARLTRPANLPTAAADIFAGVAIASFVQNIDFEDMSVFSSDIFLLVLASIFLYAGGVVLNDAFDYDLDKIERPERPIPSGVVPIKTAFIFGFGLLLTGVTTAYLVNSCAAVIALILAISIYIYDKYSKKHDFIGPLNMGICRGLNLLLGLSIFGSISYWWLAIIPLIYIFSITLISRGEVHGNNKENIVKAGSLYGLVFVLIFFAIIYYSGNILTALPFLILFATLIFRPLIKAFKDNSPKNIKGAVIAGVLSIIVLDASLAAAFMSWQYALAMLLLLPMSFGLSKLFAVT